MATTSGTPQLLDEEEVQQVALVTILVAKTSRQAYACWQPVPPPSVKFLCDKDVPFAACEETRHLFPARRGCGGGAAGAIMPDRRRGDPLR